MSLLASFVGALLAAGPAPSEGFVSTDDGVKLHYRSVGAGPAVVIPVEVLTSPHFDPLAEKFRVVYYDPRGRGRSDRGDLSRCTPDREVKDLEAVRAALGLESFSMVGWSEYGLTAARYALAFPTRVTRLVQLAPLPPRFEPFMSERGKRMAERIDQKAWAEYKRRVANHATGHDACLAYQRAMALTSMTPDGFKALRLEQICSLENEWPDRQDALWGTLLKQLSPMDLRPQLHSLELPRLVIAPERDLVPLDGVREWVVGKSARLLRLKGADHSAFLDQPRALLDAISVFLSGQWPKGSSPR